MMGCIPESMTADAADGTRPKLDVAELLDTGSVSSKLAIITGLLFCVMCLDGYDLYIASQLVPETARAFSVTAAALTRALAAQISGQAIGAMVLSPVADRLGRKPVLLVSLALFGVTTLFSAMASTLTLFTISRLLSGILGGGLMPATVSLVADLAPQRRRSALVGIVYAGLYVGPLGSAAVTAWLLRSQGWTSAFWIGGLAPLLLAPFVAVIVPESPRLLARRGATGEVIRRALRKLGPPPPAGGFAAGESVRTGAPVAELFRQGRATLTLSLWATSVCSLTVTTLLALASTLYHEFAGVPLHQFAGALAIGLVGGVAAAFSTGWAMDRFGRYTILSTYSFVGALFVFAVPWMKFGSYPFLAAMFFAGFFASGVQQALNILAPLLYPTLIRSEGVGWKGGVSRLASTAAPLLGGVLLASGLGLHVAFAAIATPLLLVGLLTPALRRASQPQAAPRQT